MAAQKSKITIIGCGPGAPDYLTPAGWRAIQAADVLVGAPRLLASFASGTQEQIAIGPRLEDALEAIALHRQSRRVAVLVTGDPGLASLAKPVLKRFGPQACEVLPGISAVQTAFARLGLDWQDARILNAHDRLPATGAAELAGCDKIAVLAGKAEAVIWTADLMDRLGPGRALYVCEDLTLDRETVQSMTPARLRTYAASSRTVILLIKEDLPA